METLVQVGTLLLGLCLVWVAQTLAKMLLRPSRARGRAKAQARHHFVSGAQLLARSRSAGKPSLGRSLARQANSEADKAIAIDPLDAACYVLKCLALEQQGLLPAALESMNTALSPNVVKSLSDSEKADALMKRGGLLIATSKGKRNLDAAIDDLQRSLELSPNNSKVLCMLAACYEKKGLYPEADKSYERAFALDPDSDDAKAGLMRLRP